MYHEMALENFKSTCKQGGAGRVVVVIFLSLAVSDSLPVSRLHSQLFDVIPRYGRDAEKSSF